MTYPFDTLRKFFERPQEPGAGPPYTYDLEPIEAARAESVFGGMLDKIAEDGLVVVVRDREGAAVQWHAPSEWERLRKENHGNEK